MPTEYSYYGKAPQHPFSTDRPITSKNEDLLGRADFAGALAASIAGWKGNDSLVIALYGAWGSGKSSVKNLVWEQLQRDADTCPEIVEFNPWQWTGQDRLAVAFYREVGVALGRADPTEEGKKRAAKWKAYGALLTLGATTSTSLTGLATLLGRPMEAGFLASVAIGLNEMAKVFQRGADARAKRSSAADRELSELKQDLSNDLKSLKKPVLVVMDDIDRLTAEEIRLLFQLVKANADFPNLIYLLLFQRENVTKSLEDIAPSTGVGSGDEFLEKIVQVGFDIPHVSQARIEKVLFTKLDGLLSDPLISKRFSEREKHRWHEIYLGGLRDYFETLRDVHRFISILSLQMSMFRKGDSFEANPVDLIAIAALRHFEPDVYGVLPNAKWTLTESAESVIRSFGGDEEKERPAEPILVKAKRREQVSEILKELFPQAASLFGGMRQSTRSSDEWMQDLRICHRELFDRYFQLSIPEGDVPQAEIDYLITNACDRDLVVKKLLGLRDRELLVPALGRLEAHKERIPAECAKAMIIALFDIGDDLPRGSRGMFDIPVEWLASFIIEACLKKEPKRELRGSMLGDAIKATKGLNLPVTEVSLQSDEDERKKNPDAFAVREEDLKTLYGICGDKIRDAASSGRLQQNLHMDYILYRWDRWGKPDEAKQWVANLITTDDGLCQFLSKFIGKQRSHALGEHSELEQKVISIEGLQKLVKLDDLKQRVAQLSKGTLTAEQREVVALFESQLRDGDRRWR